MIQHTIRLFSVQFNTLLLVYGLCKYVLCPSPIKRSCRFGPNTAPKCVVDFVTAVATPLLAASPPCCPAFHLKAPVDPLRRLSLAFKSSLAGFACDVVRSFRAICLNLGRAAPSSWNAPTGAPCGSFAERVFKGLGFHLVTSPCHIHTLSYSNHYMRKTLCSALTHPSVRG